MKLFLSTSPKAMMVLSAFPFTLISVLLFQSAVAKVEESALVSANEATNRNGSDHMRSADQRDDLRDFLIKTYGWGNAGGDSAEFKAFFAKYSDCGIDLCTNGGICSKTEFNGHRCDCVYWTWGPRCEQPLDTKIENYCCFGSCKRYQGKVNFTKSGRTCQRWDEKKPHSHNYNPKKYPYLEENYCRNPSHHTNTWCYTTDPGKRWEDCDTTFCGTFLTVDQRSRDSNEFMVKSELWLAALRSKSLRQLSGKDGKFDYNGAYSIVSWESGKLTAFDDAIPWMKSFLNKGYSLANAAEITVRYYADLPISGR